MSCEHSYASDIDFVNKEKYKCLQYNIYEQYILNTITIKQHILILCFARTACAIGQFVSIYYQYNGANNNTITVRHCVDCWVKCFVCMRISEHPTERRYCCKNRLKHIRWCTWQTVKQFIKKKRMNVLCLYDSDYLGPGENIFLFGWLLIVTVALW